MAEQVDPSMLPLGSYTYKVQEDGFIYGEFYRLKYAIVFAKALSKELGTEVSIHGPNGWEEYDG